MLNPDRVGRQRVAGFPLDGAHKNVACSTCHKNGYAGTPTDCYSCHRTNFEGTRDPNHVAAGFPTQCVQCHNTTAWQPAAAFDHSRTGFPLTGAHKSTACSACHKSTYAGTPTDCYACHRSDYDGTRDPNHAAAGFPTQCVQCHNTNGWNGATFNHDSYFPINSGSHAGVWSNCAECHVSPGNYAQFECVLCHEHSRQNTDGHHREVRNYRYESPACYACHPRGRAG